MRTSRLCRSSKKTNKRERYQRSNTSPACCVIVKPDYEVAVSRATQTEIYLLAGKVTGSSTKGLLVTSFFKFTNFKELQWLMRTLSVTQQFSHRWCWTRQACWTGWRRRLPPAEPLQPSLRWRSCRTSGWTAKAEARARVYESTPRGAWQLTIRGGRRCPLLWSERSNESERM